MTKTVLTYVATISIDICVQGGFCHIQSYYVSAFDLIKLHGMDLHKEFTQVEAI